MKTPALIVLALATTAAPAQRLTILLDPARGGTEDGARIDEHTPEKQATLDLANRLRSLLNARDFNVVLTREGDTVVSNDSRAALANTSKPIACILLHATAAGKGLHLFTSSLAPTAPQGPAVPWDEAQSPYVQRSQRLANELTTAFGRSRIPVSSGHTWIRPLDNMQCPAIAVEIAPDSDGVTAADRGYQTRIADAIAGAMLFWRGHTDIVQSIVPPPPVPTATVQGNTPAPTPVTPRIPTQTPQPTPRPPAPRLPSPTTGALPAKPLPPRTAPATTTPSPSKPSKPAAAKPAPGLTTPNNGGIPE